MPAWKNTALVDRLSIRASYSDKDGRGTEEEEQHLIPEEIVNKISQFVGDGKGRLSVGAALSSSVNFGYKAEAMVNASVACDSDPDVMVAVNDILYPMVEELTVLNHARMSKLRDQMIPDSEGDKRLNLEVETDSPPPAKPASRPQKAVADNAPKVPAKAKAPIKPAFRR